MVTESKISIEEYIQWKSAQTNNNAYSSRDTSEDSDDEIGELIFQQSRTGKARAEVERNSASDTTNVLCQNESDSSPPSNRGESKPPIIADDSPPLKQSVDYQQVRELCHTQRCIEIAVKEGRCQMHGRGERRICKKEGCTNYVQKGGVCKRHGAVVKRKACSHEGCTNITQKRGVCVRHGAPRKICSHEGCTTYVQKGGVCCKHGANKTIKKRKTCSHKGCTKQVQKRGLCIRHGANKL